MSSQLKISKFFSQETSKFVLKTAEIRVVDIIRLTHESVNKSRQLHWTYRAILQKTGSIFKPSTANYKEYHKSSKSTWHFTSTFPMTPMLMKCGSGVINQTNKTIAEQNLQQKVHIFNKPI